MDRKERVKGLLNGVALGDAFGMSTEMLTRFDIENRNLVIDEPIDSLDISPISKNRRAYSITDDTMNTLMILKMLKENGNKIDTQAYINSLKIWRDNSPIAGYVTGPSTSRALNSIDEGVSVEESGKFGTTNGAAMKIGPIGLISNWHNLDELIQNVVKICKPTHNTNVAIKGACAIAAAVSYFSDGNTCIDGMYNIIYQCIEKAEGYGYNWPSASLKYRIEYARNIVQKNDVKTALIKLYDEIGTSMETIDTIPTSLALVKLSKLDALKCAKLCAVIGGDTDTIGAIAVGICGVANPKSIPKYMVDKIEEVNNLNFDDFII